MSLDFHDQTSAPAAEACARRLHALFVCGPGRMRSLTAEHIFATRSHLQVAAAGIDSRPGHVLTPELLRWADIVFVMEDAQAAKLVQRFSGALNGKQVVSLGIPDCYEYMDPQLVRLLKAKTAPYFG